jgi:hypothetical protein
MGEGIKEKCCYEDFLIINHGFGSNGLVGWKAEV